MTDAQVFESHRPSLLALAYRMLGEMARAEDIVQEAWIRWDGREVEVDSPQAYLLKIVTRLCLNELDSARMRREESRGDRLPEPIDLGESALMHLEGLDRVSMAFLVVLQRLSPVERAVLLLHDVFELEHAEIGELLHKTEAACRQLLRRARANVGTARRTLTTSRDEHLRVLRAFAKAANSGRTEEFLALLANDAVMIADGGPKGARVAGVRNLPAPLVGAQKIAPFLAAFARRDAAQLRRCVHELNGQPAIVALEHGVPVAALLLAVAEGKIAGVFIQADPARLKHLGAVVEPS